MVSGERGREERTGARWDVWMEGGLIVLLLHVHEAFRVFPGHFGCGLAKMRMMGEPLVRFGLDNEKMQRVKKRPKIRSET